MYQRFTLTCTTIIGLTIAHPAIASKGTDFIAFNDSYTMSAATLCDQTHLRVLDVSLPDEAKSNPKVKNHLDEYRKRVTVNAAQAERYFEMHDRRDLIEKKLPEFAQTVVDFTVKAVNTNLPLQQHIAQCIDKAKAWGGPLDKTLPDPKTTMVPTDKLTGPKGILMKDAFTLLGVEYQATPKTEKKQADTSSLDYLKELDKLKAMDAAKPVSKRTKEDWKAMDEQALKMLESMNKK